MKKIIAIILSALLVTFSLTGCYGLGFLGNLLNDDTEDYEDIEIETTDFVPSTEESTTNYVYYPEETQPPAIENVNVRPAEWASVQWEPYSNQYFTLQIPSGWQVEFQGDANQLAWRAVSPDGKIGFFNQDHAYAAKDASMASTLGFSISLSEGTVQEYFETMYKDTTDTVNPSVHSYPRLSGAVRYLQGKRLGRRGCILRGDYGFQGRNHQRFKLRRVGDQLYLHPVGAYGQSC